MMSVLLTLLWALAVAVAPGIGGAVSGRSRRLAYVGAMASTGLTGVTGLGLIAVGSWLTLIFPWLGLVAVIGHGIAGARGRRALSGGRKRAAVASSILQILFLAAAYGVMTVKPF